MAGKPPGYYPSGLAAIKKSHTSFSQGFSGVGVRATPAQPMLRLTPPASDAPRRRRVVLLARAGVLTLAGLLRFVGIGFAPGTPWGRPDEEIFATVALRLFSDPSPHTAETGWPELWFRAHYYVQAVLRAIWSARYGGDPNLGCVLTVDPSSMIEPVRAFTAALSVGTVWLVMRLARRVGPRSLSEGEREAVSLVAGLFYSVNVLVMRDAHFAVSDQALLFFLVWMFLAAARGLDEGHIRDFAACGLALGFAIGTKWTGLTFGIVPVIALGMRIRRFGASPSNAAAIIVGTLATAGAFLITNPTFLQSAQPFLDGISGQMLRYDPNAPQAFTIYQRAPMELGLTRHLRVSIPFAFGWPLTIVAVLGTFACLIPWRRTKQRPVTWLLAFFTVFFHVGIVGRTTMYFARYSLPEHPGLAVFGALAVVMTAKWIAERWQRPIAMRLAMAITALLALEPTWRSIELDWFLCLPETRDLALRYVHQLAGDQNVDVSGNYARVYGQPPRFLEACEEILPPPMRRWVMRLGTYPDSGSLASGRPGSWPVIGETGMMGPLHRPTYTRSAEWLLLTMPYLPCDQPVNEYAVVRPPSCFTELRRFEPVGIACDAQWDDQDHFYAPLWGYTSDALFSGSGRARIGPLVIVYHDDCHSH